MKLSIKILGLALFAVLFACEEKEEQKPPKADFEFEVVDGSGVVKFTNTSTDADVFTWEFGDLENSTSIEENPEFTYRKAGSYTVTVTLTAGVGASGENDMISKTIDLTNVPASVLIDGDVSDWEGVPYVENAVGDGALTKLKVEAMGNNINIYIEGTADLDVSSPSLFFDLDENTATGGLFDWYVNPNLGIDFFSDGSKHWYALHNDASGQDAWDWIWANDPDGWLTVADVVEITGGKAVEMSIAKDKLNTLSGGMLSENGVYFGFSDKKGGEIPAWGTDQGAVYIPFK